MIKVISFDFSVESAKGNEHTSGQPRLKEKKKTDQTSENHG